MEIYQTWSTGKPRCSIPVS